MYISKTQINTTYLTVTVKNGEGYSADATVHVSNTGISIEFDSDNKHVYENLEPHEKVSLLSAITKTAIEGTKTT